MGCRSEVKANASPEYEQLLILCRPHSEKHKDIRHDRACCGPAPRLLHLLRALPAWLTLPRDERRSAWQTQDLLTVLSDAGQISLRFFDAEAFTARCSDVLLVETGDVDSHNDFMEALRDSPVFARPYFELVDIIPAIEDGFQRYEARTSR